MPHYGIFETHPSEQAVQVQFSGDCVPDQINIAEAREQLSAILRDHGSLCLIFDFTNVKRVGGTFLALLAGFARQGNAIQIDNPSVDLREILHITKLDQHLRIHPPLKRDTDQEPD